jgi:signal transduction histidine kinase
VTSSLTPDSGTVNGGFLRRLLRYRHTVTREGADEESVPSYRERGGLIPIVASVPDEPARNQINRCVHSTAVRSWFAGVLSLAIVIWAVLTNNALVSQPAPVLRAILDTSVAIIGTLVAILGFGRFRRTGNPGDLAVVCAVGLLAWVHTLFGSVPDLISPYSVGNGISERYEVWGTLVVRLMAAGFLIASVQFRESRSCSAPVSGLRRCRAFVLSGPLGALAIVILAWRVPITRNGLVVQASWPASISPVCQLLGALLFLVAFARVSSRARAQSDEFLGWIAVGCIFAMFAMISYGLLPAGGAETLGCGDLLRAAAVSVWAVGAIAEIRSYWSTVAESARIEARRSAALDLHDGLAQELALLSAYTYYPASERATPEWQGQLRLTAERALTEARRAIAVLANADPIPLHADLGRAAQVASGSDVDVHVEVDAEGIESDRVQRESIVRIVREAVTNAVRHGGARHIEIRFGTSDVPILRISDDGAGFDVVKAAETGRFGLLSMQERAEKIGGSLQVHSAPGQGTTVEVLWP